MKQEYTGIYNIKVLDSIYTLYICNDRDNSNLIKLDADAVTDIFLKNIYIYNTFLEYDNEEKLNEEWLKKSLRHELIHAFIHECGLTENNSKEVNWAVDEGMIDFWALQYYKIGKVFQEVYSIIPELKKFAKDKKKQLRKI